METRGEIRACPLEILSAVVQLALIALKTYRTACKRVRLRTGAGAAKGQTS